MNNTFYAIKDTNTNLYFNRIHKEFRPLAQNTAFYKTEKSANDELIHTIGCTLSIKFRKYCKMEGIRFNWKDYEDYYKLHKNDVSVKVVKIKFEEIE